MRTYDGPEHESFRAVQRSMWVNYGWLGRDRVSAALKFMGVASHYQLSPWGANRVRKMLQEQLPPSGDLV